MMKSAVLILLSILASAAAPAQAPAGSDIEKWQSQVAATPKDANAWEQLGLAYHGAGRSADAIAPLNKALELGYAPMIGRYNLACAYAKSGSRDKAIETLQQIVSQGGGAGLPMATDADLESLREQPAFQALLASLKDRTEPCRNGTKNPEFRQLDFWIGEWDVFNAANKQQVGDSSVQLILKDCVVFENWKARGGFGEGKSFNKYNPRIRKWEQFWVADSGGTTHYVGEGKPGEVQYFGEGATPQGAAFTRRLTFTKLENDRVRQFEEISSDGGKTWSVGYDYLYVRKANSARAQAGAQP
jgi:hypothetical protein